VQLIALLALAAAMLAPARPSSPDADDLLGDIVVEATDPGRGGPRLMKILLPPVEGTGKQAELVDQVVRRDLELSGQFALLDDADPKAKRSAEAVIEISVRNPGGGATEIRAAVWFDPEAEAPAYETSIPARIADTRAACHRLVDAIIGTLTGYRGPFVSRLSFVITRGNTRAVYVMDPDGFGLRKITDETRLAGAAALGPDDALYYSASTRNGRYRLYREGRTEPFTLDPPGSVYGIAFSEDRTRVALTIAIGRDIRLYTGPSSLDDLTPLGDISLTLSPAFSARGSIAISGATAIRPRIWVDGRPVSPRGGTASSPDFCEHPDGTKLTYALGTRRRSNIVVADPNGRNALQVTRAGARHSHPACSPDGRLIAFFSDRRSGDGPGLYLMRIDGYRLRKVASVLGDSLQWARVTPREDGSRGAP
jgi:TolB protein